MKSKNAKDWYQEGAKYQSSKQYKEAINCYQEVIRLDPQYFDACYNLGYSLASLARSELSESLFMDACEIFEKASQLKPDHYRTFADWGHVLTDLAYIREDISSNEEAIRIYNKFEEELKKHDITAEQHLDIPFAYIEWGYTLYRMGNMKEELFDEALMKKPMEM